MTRLLGFLAIILLASCSPPPPPPPTPVAAAVPQPSAPPAPRCTLAANGAPILTDRGIGGTGITMADRGIGGTGIGNEIPPSVVRGFTEPSRTPRSTAPDHLGSVGMVGVITGFGSVCVDGNEVVMDGAVPVEIDGKKAIGSDLRAGQIAVINATSDDTGLRALHLSVRHEVVGPIEKRDGDRLLVAGQTIRLTPKTWNGSDFGPGDWVAVSGLHAPDGSIAATRLDAAPKGTVVVHGQVTATGGRLRLNEATLSTAAPVEAGSFIIATGSYAGGLLRAGKTEPDRLLADPIGYFGPAVKRVILHAIGRVEDQRLRLNGSTTLPLAADAKDVAPGPVDAVFAVQREADGSYTARREDDSGTPPAKAEATQPAKP